MVRIEVKDRKQLEEWFTEGKDGKSGVLEMVWERIRFLRGENVDAKTMRKKESPDLGKTWGNSIIPELKQKISNVIDGHWGDKEKLRSFLVLSPEEIEKMGDDGYFSSLKERLDKQDSEIDGDTERRILKFIFDYDKWMNQAKAFFGPYDLTKELGIDVCPYCNRQYVHTILAQGGTGIVRPQIDHFYPKSTYPQFALCLYNLIPACSNCNQRKSSKSGKVINPYMQGIHREATFSVQLGQEKNEEGWNYQVNLMGSDKTANKHIEVLKLEELYKTAHQDHLEELIEKTDENSSYYYAHLENLLQEQGLSIDREEFYQFYFGNYPDPKDFHKRPLAKFTHDILKDLGVDIF